MSKKKPGFLGRLLGKGSLPEEETGEAKKEPPAEAGFHPEPGPPETTPEWVERAEHERPDPVPTHVTPEAAEGEEHPHLSPAPPEATFDPVQEAPEPKSAAGEEEEPEKKRGWLARLASGLKRSSDQLSDNIGAVFTKRKLDADTLEELEDVLIQADLGVDVAMSITAELAKDRFDKEISTGEVRAVLAAEVQKVLEPVARPLETGTRDKPFVILMVGVNGSGKTTTIGKLAQKFSDEGKKVMLAAGDTFRAAAIEQLQIWGKRTGAPVVTRPAGADASGLAFDAVSRARADNCDVLIIDTAGRLQNRDELMAELEKIIRVMKKVDESAPHAVLLTLDATTGQNALQQVETFGRRAGVTGLVMTKLDGTARGGILVAIARKYALPVHFVGVGEGVDDLEAFTAVDFASAIAGEGPAHSSKDVGSA
ncbi:MAG TPA: signal recognition particle-docking protein FtsY [Devosia sp.]|nr:signal recognition particle-docking protein FtsY [Devosia sp.]